MPKKTPPLLPEPPWQVILEDIRSQNRATLEAVESFEGRYARDRTEDRARTDGRFDVIEGVLREHSRDIREIKTDVAVLKTDVALLKADVAAIKTDLRRVDDKVDHLSALEPRVTALERSRD
jgi:septal ring factor EnvC (AmiA/AmiB activator)